MLSLQGNGVGGAAALETDAAELRGPEVSAQGHLLAWRRVRG
ncbi:hypothetical protein [Terriglobus sp.]